jgi:hypothetical protein
MSIKVHPRHARCTRPAYGLRELEPAETMQVAPFDHATPLNVIRSIDRAEILCAAFLFVSAFVGIGVFFAMGTK